MDNKFQNGYEQIKISDKLEAVVLTAIKKAEIVKKRKKIKTKILKLSIAVASILIIFIISVNVSPIFAQSVKTLPVVGGIVKYFEVYLDKGVKSAAENNFIQKTNMSFSNNGIKIEIDNIIPDNKKLTIMYTLSVEKGHDNLQGLLPKNFIVTDKQGRLIFSTVGSSVGVKEFRDDKTGELLDYINLLELSGPKVVSKSPDGEPIYDKNPDVPDKEYLRKVNAVVFQNYNINKNFTVNKKATGTIQITSLDGNFNIPDELNIKFIKLIEAYYQPTEELFRDKETKQFTKEAFVSKNNREAIEIDGSWSFKLDINKAMKETKPKVINNIKFTAGNIDFNIEKIEEFPTKVDLTILVGKCNGKDIEDSQLRSVYLVDDKGKRYEELHNSSIPTNTHEIGVSFESYYFDNPKELYLVIDAFDYSYQVNGENMKSVNNIKVKIK